MKYCVSCGNQLRDEAAFCPICGAAQPGTPNQNGVNESANVSSSESVNSTANVNSSASMNDAVNVNGAQQGYENNMQNQQSYANGIQNQQGNPNNIQNSQGYPNNVQNPQGYPNNVQNPQGYPNNVQNPQGYPNNVQNPQGYPNNVQNPQGYPNNVQNPQGYPNNIQNPQGYPNVMPQPHQNSNIVPILVLVIVVLLVSSVLMLVLLKTEVISIGGKNAEVSESTESTTSAGGAVETDQVTQEGETTDNFGEVTTEAAPEYKTVTNDSPYEDFQATVSTRQPMHLEYASSDVTDYPTVKLYYTVQDEAEQTLILTNPMATIKEKVNGGQDIYHKVKSVEILQGNQGVSFDICADKSGSMDHDIDTMKMAMNDFISTMDTASGDKAELIAFDSYVMYMCTYTDDKNLLKNGINNMVPDGMTALYDALYYGVQSASTREGARCVIAFTDGADNESMYTYDSVINLANQYSVPIFIIYTREGDANTCEYIASETGGRSWSIDSVSGMSEVLQEIYKMEKDMYCVEYESDTSIGKTDERIVECIMMDDTYGSMNASIFTPTEKLKVRDHGNSRYEVVQADVSWTEANRAAMEAGGHLVTITSQSEMDEVTKLCEAKKIRFVWMGGYTSIMGNASFGHWITGEPFDFTFWYPGEPSRQDRNDDVEEMYLMLWDPADDGRWSWNDQRENVFDTKLSYFPGNVGYVIEWEE